MSFDDQGRSWRGHGVRFGAIGEAWALFKERWGTWVLAGLIVSLGNSLLLGAVHSVFHLKLPVHARGGFMVPVPPARDLLPATIVMVVDGLLLGGLFRLACLQVRLRRFAVSDLFGVGDVLVELVFGSALLGMGLAASAAFCAVIPAFVLAGVWMLVIPLIVDARLRALDAFGQSWRALKGEWLSATVFHLVVSFVAGFGFCFCGIGGFVTMPLYALSIAVLYRDIFFQQIPTEPEKPAFVDPDF